jgi:hypothetical protein
MLYEMQECFRVGRFLCGCMETTQARLHPGPLWDAPKEVEESVGESDLDTHTNAPLPLVDWSRVSPGLSCLRREGGFAGVLHLVLGDELTVCVSSSLPTGGTRHFHDSRGESSAVFSTTLAPF